MTQVIKQIGTKNWLWLLRAVARGTKIQLKNEMAIVTINKHSMRLKLLLWLLRHTPGIGVIKDARIGEYTINCKTVII